MIAAYCLLRDFYGTRRGHSWISEEDKLYTSIWGDREGDFHLMQLDMHPKFNQKRLDNAYPLFAELPERAISLHYDYWNSIAVIPFKYSKQTGIEFKELDNWRNLLDVDPRESQYFDYDNFEFDNCEMIRIPKRIENNEINWKKYPFGVISSENIHFIPAIDKDENLWIYKSNENGIRITNFGKYKPYVKISKEDIPNLLKGVIHAVKNYHTRMHPSTLAYILEELNI